MTVRELLEKLEDQKTKVVIKKKNKVDGKFLFIKTGEKEKESKEQSAIPASQVLANSGEICAKEVFQFNPTFGGQLEVFIIE